MSSKPSSYRQYSAGTTRTSPVILSSFQFGSHECGARTISLIDAGERGNAIYGTADTAKCGDTLETLTLPPDVDRFVVANGLGDFLKEALAELKDAFGTSVETRYEVFKDPSDGSATLYFNVVADDLEFAQRRLSRFSYAWWYDRIVSHGHLVGFRIVEDLGD